MMKWYSIPVLLNGILAVEEERVITFLSLQRSLLDGLLLGLALVLAMSVVFIGFVALIVLWTEKDPSPGGNPGFLHRFADWHAASAPYRSEAVQKTRGR